jgi:hypothetical protein
MTEKRHILAQKVKEMVLSEAISAVSIKEVEEKYPDGEKDGDVYWSCDKGYSIHCYIKTHSLKTIDIAKLDKTIQKYSNGKVDVSYIVYENCTNVEYEKNGINYRTSEQDFINYNTSEKEGIINCVFEKVIDSMVIYIRVT